MAEQKFIRTCSIWRALEVVGDTSTLLILEASWIGARRFDDIRVRSGLLPTLLSNRLKRLVEAGILEKRLYSQKPPRHEYRLTDKGRDLYWTALMMLRWEHRWAPREGKLDIRLRHRTCGQLFEPTPTCLRCKTEISARDVSWTEGPGVGWMAVRYSRRRQQRNAAAERADHTALMDEVAQITGDRWASLALRSIFTGLRKFDEICRDTAMATNILSERLSWLVEKGVIELHEYSATPRRYEYRLTEKGIDYYPVLLMLLQWGDKYYLSPEGPPLLLRHRADGHDLEPAVTCSCCGEPIRIRDVEYEVVEPQPSQPRLAAAG
jgi:DNA-binding HxlR family transcriptional regulator